MPGSKLDDPDTHARMSPKVLGKDQLCRGKLGRKARCTMQSLSHAPSCSQHEVHCLNGNHIGSLDEQFCFWTGLTVILCVMQPISTATTPVSGPGLPPGSTETVTFVPSGAPTPPGMPCALACL